MIHRLTHLWSKYSIISQLVISKVIFIPIRQSGLKNSVIDEMKSLTKTSLNNDFEICERYDKNEISF